MPPIWAPNGPPKAPPISVPRAPNPPPSKPPNPPPPPPEAIAQSEFPALAADISSPALWPTKTPTTTGQFKSPASNSTHTVHPIGIFFGFLPLP